MIVDFHSIIERHNDVCRQNRMEARPSCIGFSKMAASRSDATSLPTFDGVENLITMTDIQKAFDELCVEEVRHHSEFL